MARLRHFAVVVKDLKKSAAFIRTSLIKRIGREDLEIGSAIYVRRRRHQPRPANFKGPEGTGPPT
jgi:hypothetical protein